MLGLGLALLVVAGPAVPSADAPVEVSSGQGLPIAGLETAGARSGRQLVVWLQTASGVDDPRQLWGRAIGADGQPVGPAFAISRATVDGTAVHAETPAVAARGKRDEFLVVWSQRIGDSSNRNLVGRRFGVDGTPLSDEFAMTPLSQFASAFDPSIAYGARRREFVVAWDALPPEAGPGPTEIGHEVYAARLRAGRSETPSSIRISSTGDGPNDEYAGTAPAVAYNPQRGDYLIAWDGEVPHTGLRAPFARTLPAHPAGRLSRTRRLSAPATEYGLGPDVAFNPRTDTYAATWSIQASRPDARVYGRRVRPNGRPRGNEVKIAPESEFENAGGADIEARLGRGYQVVYAFSDVEFGDFEVVKRRLGSKLQLRRARRVAGGQQGVSAGGPGLAIVSRDRHFRVVWFERRDGQAPRVLLRDL